MSPRCMLLPESVAVALRLVLPVSLEAALRRVLAPDLPMPLAPLSAVEGWLEGPPGWLVMGRESVSLLAGLPEPEAALRLLMEPVVPDEPPG